VEVGVTEQFGLAEQVPGDGLPRPVDCPAFVVECGLPLVEGEHRGGYRDGEQHRERRDDTTAEQLTSPEEPRGGRRGGEHDLQVGAELVGDRDPVGDEVLRAPTRRRRGASTTPATGSSPPLSR
jgi:hypothetical protein